MTNLLSGQKFECRVSSVLNKNAKNYGKQFMFDNDDITCWNSDFGNPQWILFIFNQEICLSSMEIQFQGGFAGLRCHLEAGSNKKNLKFIQDISPEDKNSKQFFKLTSIIKTKIFKIVFESSTDFFGRVIIYKLALYS